MLGLIKLWFGLKIAGGVLKLIALGAGDGTSVSESTSVSLSPSASMSPSVRLAPSKGGEKRLEVG